MAAGDDLIDDDGNDKLDADGNDMVDDGAGNDCGCGCGTPCYIPLRCDDDTPATFGIPASLVLRKPMFFKLAGGDGTVYYIPADATPTDCPEDVEVAIVEVVDCAGRLPACVCFAWSSNCNCIYTLAWAKVAKPTLDSSSPGGVLQGSADAYNAWDGIIPIYITYDLGGHVNCINSFQGWSAPWTYAGDQYRNYYFLDDNEFFVYVEKYDVVDYDPDTGDPIYGWVDSGAQLLFTRAQSQTSCCVRQWTAWHDYTDDTERSDTLTITIVNNKCCQSSLVSPADFYNGGTTYAAGDLVFYGSPVDYVWQSLQNGNTGHAPDLSPTWWQRLYTYPCAEIDSDDCPAGTNCEDLEI